MKRVLWDRVRKHWFPTVFKLSTFSFTLIVVKA